MLTWKTSHTDGYQLKCKEAVINQMHNIFNLAWKEEKVLGYWIQATIVPVYKRKRDKNECDNTKELVC